MASVNREPTGTPATAEAVAAPVLTTIFGFALGAGVLAGAGHPAAGMAVLVAGLMATGVVDAIFRSAIDPVLPKPPPQRKLLAPPAPELPLLAGAEAETAEAATAAPGDEAPARKAPRRKTKSDTESE